MFYDPKLFPFVEYLERHAETISNEIRQLSAVEFEDTEHGNNLGIPSPSTFMALYAASTPSEEVQPVERSSVLCPGTVSILGRVQGLCSAAVSRLEPGKWIKPHVDPRKVLRCHLGISIPGQTGIRSGGQFRRWEEGKCLVMDATFVREAWNRSASDRLLLVVDIDPRAIDVDLSTSFEPSTISNQAAKAIQQVHYMARKSVTGVTKRFGR